MGAKPDKRRKDVELVLRVCAFYNVTYLNYKPPIKAFLNKEASSRRNLTSAESKELRTAFKNACQITRSMFNKNAFSVSIAATKRTLAAIGKRRNLTRRCSIT